MIGSLSLCIVKGYISVYLICGMYTDDIARTHNIRRVPLIMIICIGFSCDPNYVRHKLQSMNSNETRTYKAMRKVVIRARNVVKNVFETV